MQRITKPNNSLRRPAEAKPRKVGSRELASLLTYTTTLGSEGKVAAEPRESLIVKLKVRTNPPAPPTPALKATVAPPRVKPRELNDLLSYSCEVFHDSELAKSNALARSLPAPARVHATKPKTELTETQLPADAAWDRFIASTQRDRWGDATFALYHAREYWVSMRDELLKVSASYAEQDPDLVTHVRASVAKMSDLVDGSKRMVDSSVWQASWKSFTSTRGAEGFTAGLQALQGLGDDIRAKYDNVVCAAEALRDTDPTGADLVIRAATQTLRS